MLTICPYCTQDTGGNHEIKCPNYKQTSIIPNDSDITIPTITINPTINFTPPISNEIIEFLEKVVLEDCKCGYAFDQSLSNLSKKFCKSCIANGLLEQIKGT